MQVSNANYSESPAIKKPHLQKVDWHAWVELTLEELGGNATTKEICDHIERRYSKECMTGEIQYWRAYVSDSLRRHFIPVIKERRRKCRYTWTRKQKNNRAINKTSLESATRKRSNSGGSKTKKAAAAATGSRFRSLSEPTFPAETEQILKQFDDRILQSYCTPESLDSVQLSEDMLTRLCISSYRINHNIPETENDFFCDIHTLVPCRSQSLPLESDFDISPSAIEPMACTDHAAMDAPFINTPDQLPSAHYRTPAGPDTPQFDLCMVDKDSELPTGLFDEIAPYTPSNTASGSSFDSTPDVSAMNWEYMPTS